MNVASSRPAGSTPARHRFKRCCSRSCGVPQRSLDTRDGCVIRFARSHTKSRNTDDTDQFHALAWRRKDLPPYCRAKHRNMKSRSRGLYLNRRRRRVRFSASPYTWPASRHKCSTGSTSCKRAPNSTGEKPHSCWNLSGKRTKVSNRSLRGRARVGSRGSSDTPRPRRVGCCCSCLITFKLAACTRRNASHSSSETVLVNLTVSAASCNTTLTLLQIAASTRRLAASPDRIR
mmetsp:Transcript_39329/g.91980  ORF Transcript_39329/g.91980 Transcript_39329/m.91980 type:complete len:232 (-) Transcript_39329:152-847(-)